MAPLWRKLLDPRGEPILRHVPRDRPEAKAGQSVVVPTVEGIDAMIRAIPYGETRTVKELRADLADAHGAEMACPVTTGFHLRGIAEAVMACLADGVPPEAMTPVWRIVDESSPLLRKAPGGAAGLLASRRRAEA